ncbi:hypothetical protein FB45DRAFT_880310 [Roridomyces roridus]|uniref:Uncharacterized protein n=1 Tax=Roridomyces roridus TaxID=1738132 RepID=A0AAD7AYR0_9AGAR|nr:hypothetical protein FB45DRAFT_880310 [Roridomyces roridus]
MHYTTELPAVKAKGALPSYPGWPSLPSPTTASASQRPAGPNVEKQAVDASYIEFTNACRVTREGREGRVIHAGEDTGPRVKIQYDREKWDDENIDRVAHLGQEKLMSIVMEGKARRGEEIWNCGDSQYDGFRDSAGEQRVPPDLESQSLASRPDRVIQSLAKLARYMKGHLSSKAYFNDGFKESNKKRLRRFELAATFIEECAEIHEKGIVVGPLVMLVEAHTEVLLAPCVVHDGGEDLLRENAFLDQLHGISKTSRWADACRLTSSARYPFTLMSHAMAKAMATYAVPVNTLRVRNSVAYRVTGATFVVESASHQENVFFLAVLAAEPPEPPESQNVIWLQNDITGARTCQKLHSGASFARSHKPGPDGASDKTRMSATNERRPNMHSVDTNMSGAARSDEYGESDKVKNSDPGVEVDTPEKPEVEWVKDGMKFKKDKSPNEDRSPVKIDPGLLEPEPELGQNWSGVAVTPDIAGARRKCSGWECGGEDWRRGRHCRWGQAVQVVKDNLYAPPKYAYAAEECGRLYLRGMSNDAATTAAAAVGSQNVEEGATGKGLMGPPVPALSSVVICIGGAWDTQSDMPSSSTTSRGPAIETPVSTSSRQRTWRYSLHSIRPLVAHYDSETPRLQAACRLSHLPRPSSAEVERVGPAWQPRYSTRAVEGASLKECPLSARIFNKLSLYESITLESPDPIFKCSTTFWRSGARHARAPVTFSYCQNAPLWSRGMGKVGIWSEASVIKSSMRSVMLCCMSTDMVLLEDAVEGKITRDKQAQRELNKEECWSDKKLSFWRVAQSSRIWDNVAIQRKGSLSYRTIGTIGRSSQDVIVVSIFLVNKQMFCEPKRALRIAPPVITFQHALCIPVSEIRHKFKSTNGHGLTALQGPIPRPVDKIVCWRQARNDKMILEERWVKKGNNQDDATSWAISLGWRVASLVSMTSKCVNEVKRRRITGSGNLMQSLLSKAASTPVAPGYTCLHPSILLLRIRDALVGKVAAGGVQAYAVTGLASTMNGGCRERDEFGSAARCRVSPCGDKKVPLIPPHARRMCGQCLVPITSCAKGTWESPPKVAEGNFQDQPVSQGDHSDQKCWKSQGLLARDQPNATLV